MITINSLSVTFPGSNGPHEVAKNLSLKIGKGEIVGLFGPSGSGKTITGLSLIGLIPKEGSVALDIDYSFENQDFKVENIEDVDWSIIRRNHIGFVFQQAASYLNPVRRCGNQLYECIPGFQKLSKADLELKATAVLNEVGLTETKAVLKSYPFQLSIGQQQRFMIAMSLIKRPDLIIADEPFSNVDVDTRHQLLALFKQLNERFGTAFLIISHNTETLSELCDRLYAFKDLQAVEKSEAMVDQLPVFEAERKSGDVCLEVRELVKKYAVSSKFAWNPKHREILKGINLTVRQHEIAGILGRSGCGKSTMANILCGLLDSDGGECLVNGVTIQPIKMNGWKHRLRHPVQLIFQDPNDAFDPSLTIESHLNEALKHASASDGNLGVEKLMFELGLSKDLLRRKPGSLSGGQLQRFGMIMSLVTRPELLICDESFSALDHRSKTACLNVLNKVANDMDLGIIIITHDLKIVKSVCHTSYGMRDGKLTYIGNLDEFRSKFDQEGTHEVLKQFI